MRVATTLALTHSDGYVLYADPNPLKTPDHLHDWYPFWDAQAGQAGRQVHAGVTMARISASSPRAR